MKINFTPVNTAINYGINNFEISKDVFNFNVTDFKNYQFVNAENYKVLDSQEKFLQIPILNNQINQINLNFSKKVIIDRNTSVPIYLNISLGKNESLAENFYIEVGESVRASVVVSLQSIHKATHLGFLKLKLASSSRLNLIVITNLNSKSINIFNHESVLGDDAKLDFKLLDFGCHNSVVLNQCSLNGNGAKSNLKVIYLGKDENKLDYNFVQNLNGKNCVCDIDTVGALFQRACKNFKGTIVFNKGCKKSIGNEKESCMLLSQNAKSKALPMMLCYEEDVSGNHSTAVGSLNKKELFYIMSRGFTKQEAIKMLVKAKFSGIIDDIFDESIKEEVLSKIDERIKL